MPRGSFNLLCSSPRQAKGGHCFARPALKGGSGATHSWPLTQRLFPRSSPVPSSLASLPEQPEIPHVHLPSKPRQALNASQGPAPLAAPCHNPLLRWRGTRWVTQPREGCGAGVTRADYSTQKALQIGCTNQLGLMFGVTRRPPEPIHGRRRNVNKHGGLQDTWYQGQGRQIQISHPRATRGGGVHWAIGHAAITHKYQTLGWHRLYRRQPLRPETEGLHFRLLDPAMFFLKKASRMSEKT